MDYKVNYSKLIKHIIILNEKDNVGVALKDILPGTYLLNNDDKELKIIIKEKIEAGFKVCVQHINNKDVIYKYGRVIGSASKDINPGEKVHIHNINSLLTKPIKENIFCDT